MASRLRQVGESVEWFAISFFNGPNELDNFVDRRLVKDASGFPEDKRQILAEQNVSGKFQVIPTNFAFVDQVCELLHFRDRQRRSIFLIGLSYRESSFFAANRSTGTPTHFAASCRLLKMRT